MRPERHTPSSLPAPAASFVGRNVELEALARLLRRDDVRLITLTGPGGIGKTRLALQAARAAEGEFAQGAVFVMLAAVSDAGRVIEAVARTLDVREAPGTGLVDAVRGYLRDRELLLLLDNFEHVLDASGLVSDLLAASPGLTVLVTSRAPLHLYGEHELAVPPLGLTAANGAGKSSEAVQLFVERASGVKAGFELSAQNAPLVSEICLRLDGMPLAIELAAARVKLLSPATLLARMGRRLHLLTAAPRDAPARHRTLRSAIEWSFDLLGADERRLFARLAVFAGGFSVEAAEEVCGASLELLAALLDNSLVRSDDEGRFTMLETIREYADECLEVSGDRDDLRCRHAEFFVALAEQAEPELRGVGQVEWLRRLDAEQGDVEAALDWARGADRVDVPLRIGAALWRYWEARGSITQARGQLDEALRRPAIVDGATRARALFASGRIALRQGDLDHAKRVFAEGRALFGELGDSGGTALCTAGLGWIVHVLGPVDEAVALCREAVAFARESGESWIIADALNNLGVALCTKGDLPAARRALEEALKLRRSIGELEGITAALNGLALMAIATDGYAEAEALFEEAFAVSEQRGDLFYEAARDVVLAYLAFARGDLGRATTLCLHALESCRRLGYLQFTAYTLETLAGIAAAEGRLREAARLLGSALTISERIGRAPETATQTSSQGVAYDWEARAVKRTLARARRELGLKPWEQETAAGRALSLDEAFAYATGVASTPESVASTVA